MKVEEVKEGEEAKETEEVKEPADEKVEDGGDKVLPKFYLRPCAEEACDSIFINGDNLPEEGVLLGHNDRIILGNNTVFLFKYPELNERLNPTPASPSKSTQEEEKAVGEGEGEESKEPSESPEESKVNPFPKSSKFFI